ncbi:MAG: hypothetical protein M0Z41_07755 [Peptococcaceae bacterium]|jgi:hypothetical protein|nr:hypothetical protein [Peptococcaceae bacterium]
MKIGIKQGIIIGAAALALSGLLAQGALATTNPQPVGTQAVTGRNWAGGMVNYMEGWVKQAAAKGEVTPQEQQVFSQMYGYMNQYAGVMNSMMGGFFNGQGSTR